MSPEKRDELMQFILQSQSNAAQRHEEAMVELNAHSAQLKEHTSQLQALAALGRDLVETARRHYQRLDRLDSPNP